MQHWRHMSNTVTLRPRSCTWLPWREPKKWGTETLFLALASTRKIPLDELLIDISQGRKRGVEFRQ